MAYVAVKGGQNAINASIERLRYERLKKGTVLNAKSIEAGMRGLIDQVMSEASLYDEELAALAIKQAEGNPEEVVFLLRAFRSTLPRKYYTRIIKSESMEVERRISASFKDIIGGQILGSSVDYTHRLIDFDLMDEDENPGEAVTWLENFNKKNAENTEQRNHLKMPKVVDYLRKEGLMITFEDNDDEPKDVTKEPLTFPTQRGERLQILTRGQTGAVSALAYASLRGFGDVHPTVGELRVGELPLTIDSPYHATDNEDDSYYIGSIKVTECECIIPTSEKRTDGSNVQKLELGYGVCYGQNETKAIAMAILDRCLEMDGDAPTNNEEFVLYHIDSVEAAGFISHLKLPHYVTFQSELDSVRKGHKKESNNEKRI
jgi:alpha-D-ribose 1-methylphosphonate 5-triphosphate synthase subunit PhnI